MSFIHSSLKNTSQTWASISLSLLSSVHVSVRHWSLVGCRLSAWHIVQKHHLPLSFSSMALTLAYGWHGTSWMCAAFCCPENRLILAQSCSPFTTLLPPMPWSQLASFHQTSDRPPAPRVPPHELEYWSGLCQLGLCVLLLLHSILFKYTIPYIMIIILNSSMLHCCHITTSLSSLFLFRSFHPLFFCKNVSNFCSLVK